MEMCFLFIILIVVCSYCILSFISEYTHSQEHSVLGWDIGTSRDVRLYIQPNKNTSIISASELCRSSNIDPLLLLVVVCSSVQDYERRNVIRETWASVLSPDVRVAFLLGTTHNSTLRDSVAMESELMNDVIQENFLDSYNNLTLKSVMMMKWVHLYCRNIRFLMKTDDDSFCNLHILVPLLRRNLRERNHLFGDLLSRVEPIRQPYDKWYVPTYMYQKRNYPNYLSGTGYVMSRDVITALYLTALRTPLIHIEDVYMTGICAARAGIVPRNQRRFSLEHWNTSRHCNHSFITIHRLSVDDFRSAWRCVSSNIWTKL